MASDPSRTRVQDYGGVGAFCGIVLRYLGFFRSVEYIGGEARSVAAQGAHTMPRRGPALGRAWVGVAALLRVFDSLSVFCVGTVNI